MERKTPCIIHNMSESVNEWMCVCVCVCACAHSLAHVHTVHMRMHMKDTTLSGLAHWQASQPARPDYCYDTTITLLSTTRITQALHLHKHHYTALCPDTLSVTSLTSKCTKRFYSWQTKKITIKETICKAVLTKCLYTLGATFFKRPNKISPSTRRVSCSWRETVSIMLK